MDTNEKLKELFSGTGFEDYNYEDFETGQELIDDMQEQINGEEIIYYSSAMEYLSRNDNSLKESLEIADEMGYEARSLSSEILASILEQRKLQDELCGLYDEIEEIYAV